MEEIYYDELLNIKIIDRIEENQKNRIRNTCMMLIVLGVLNSKVDGLFTVLMLGVFIYFLRCGYLSYKRQKEKKEVKNLVDFYNECISNNEYTELDDDSKIRFMEMSRDVIVNDLELVWEPEFICDDETKVYKVENTQVIVVNGYFEDVSISRKPKRNYIIVFIDGKYYMCWIDNLICWKKGDYYSRFYTEKSMINDGIEYKKW